MPLAGTLKHFVGVATSLLVLSLWAEEPAASPKDVRSEYVVDWWQTEHGLPDNFITSLAQTPEGYLWIGTFHGLTRFNGTEFTTFDAGNTPEFSSSRITRLKVDPTGRLWIHAETGSLAWWWNGRFKKVVLENGLLPRTEEMRCERAEVRVEAAHSTTNYFHMVGDHLESVASSKPFSTQFGEVTDLQGRDWRVISNSLCCLDAHHPLVSSIPDFRGWGWRLLPSRDGGIWVIANRFLKLRDGSWTDCGPAPIDTDQYTDYIEDHSGTLWIGTDSGELWRHETRGGLARFTFPGATMPQIGRALVEDSEGNVWVGTGGSGLFRLKPRMLRSYGSRDGLASDLVRSVTQDGAGNIWFASVNQVDCIPRGSSEIRNRPTAIQLPWEVLGCRDAGVWVASFNQGLFRVPEGNGEPIRYRLPTPGQIRSINTLFERKNGELELGTPRGLMRLSDDGLMAGLSPGIPEMDVRAMAEDTKARFYVGLENGGLLRNTGGAWEHFTTRDGLASDRVSALYADDQDVVWVGTQGGFSRFDGGKSFFTFSARAEQRGETLDLPHTITSILEDNSGFLWLASAQGLYRVNKAQLNRMAQGVVATADVFHYDREDGMGSSQCTGDHQPAAWKTRDGSLWFATMNGVTVVNPAALPFDSKPPPVMIESVYADDLPIALSAAGTNELQAPAGCSRLEFHYAALTLTAPEKARFRYQLEGFDKDWISADHRRTADYTKAPPGHYRFHVIAANHDNVWNYDGAFVNVRVLPLYWQTAWFRGTVIIVLAAAGLWVYRWRVQDLHAQRIMQESFSRQLIKSQELERKRMAAELHDSLGQSLLVLNNHAAMALKDIEGGEKARQRLDKIREGASACIEEVRTIARSLRPYQLDRFGLSKTLEDVAELLADTTGLKVTTEIENLDGLFSQEAEISIYRIAQEWLNNVVKHARASQARLVARREGARARLVLEDNGVGFDSAAILSAEGGNKSFGLINLRERVRLLGGTVQLETAAGKGTRWIIEIPYAKQHHRSDS